MTLNTVNIANEPHTHDGITFSEWNSTDSLPSAEGSYYLSNDVILGDIWRISSGTINLCLNGKTIKVNSVRGTIFIDKDATLNLYDEANAGMITNTLKDPMPEYGGVYINGGVFNMYGGTISNNTAELPNGVGGVFNYNGIVELSGDVNITGNRTDGQPSNLYLYQRSKIKIAEAMSKEARIGITTERTGIFTRGSSAKMKTSDYVDRFTSDNKEYVVRATGKDLLVGKPVSCTVPYDSVKGLLDGESTANDIGDNVTLDLEIIFMDEDEVTDEEKYLSETYMKSNNLSLDQYQYYDIGLWLEKTDGTTVYISSLDRTKINITLDVPESLRNVPDGYRRVFIVFRIHDNKAEKVAESDTTSVSFGNDEFSTFVLAYQDIKKAETTENTQKTDKTETTEKIERTYAIPITGIDH